MQWGVGQTPMKLLVKRRMLVRIFPQSLEFLRLKLLKLLPRPHLAFFPVSACLQQCCYFRYIHNVISLPTKSRAEGYRKSIICPIFGYYQANFRSHSSLSNNLKIQHHAVVFVFKIVAMHQVQTTIFVEAQNHAHGFARIDQHGIFPAFINGSECADGAR